MMIGGDEPDEKEEEEITEISRNPNIYVPTLARQAPEENKFGCSKCDEFFTKKSQYRKHVKNCYDKFKCPSCDDSFDILTDLLMLKNHYINCIGNSDNKFFGSLKNYLDN